MLINDNEKCIYGNYPELSRWSPCNHEDSWSGWGRQKSHYQNLGEKLEDALLLSLKRGRGQWPRFLRQPLQTHQGKEIPSPPGLPEWMQCSHHLFSPGKKYFELLISRFVRKYIRVVLSQKKKNWQLIKAGMQNKCNTQFGKSNPTSFSPFRSHSSTPNPIISPS